MHTADWDTPPHASQWHLNPTDLLKVFYVCSFVHTKGEDLFERKSSMWYCTHLGLTVCS